MILPLPSHLREDPFAESDVQTPGPRVGILLCTYNGEVYLREQLDSFIAQTHINWRLFVSDDGSTDATMSILEEYQVALGARMTILLGPKLGFAQNFMSLVRSDRVNSDAYAFSDQDDIWLSDKLARSLSALERMDSNAPALYCSRTQLIDPDGEVTGLTPLFQRRPGFRNALVQSLAGANTMMINEPARELLARTGINVPIVAHDWLTYLVVTGCGGSVFYDPQPTLRYRQHDGNLIGANSGLSSRFKRIGKMLGGRFRDWNEKNRNMLESYTAQLTVENQLVLVQFDLLRGRHLIRRLMALRRGGFYRQTLAGTVSLYIAVILKQV